MEQDKLTTWKNEPTVEDLKNDYTAGKASHDYHTGRIDEWLDYLNGEGVAGVVKQKGRSQVNPKFIRKQAEWKYAALTHPFLATEDLYDVNPLTYEDKEAATQNALVLNNQWATKIPKAKIIGSLVRAVVNQGTGIIRTGWVYEEEVITVMKPIFEFRPVSTPEEQYMFEGIIAEQAEDPNTFENTAPEEILQAIQVSQEQQTPYLPVQVDEEEVEEVIVLKNWPTVEMVNYHNFMVDPSCGDDLNAARFIIHNFETSLSELKSSHYTYVNLDQIKLEDAGPESTPDHTSGEFFQFLDDPRKRLVAYEYWGHWDIDGSGITKPIVATYVGETMIRMELSPYPDGKIPFVMIVHNPVAFSVYGEPDAELLKDNQRIIGAVSRGMVDIMGRSAAGQKGIAKGMLDTMNKRKYMQGQDYEFNPTQDPRASVVDHVYPEISQSASVMIQMQTMEGETMSGVRPFAGGNGGTAVAESATAVRSALDASSKREADILRRIAEGVVEIGRKFIAMNAKWLSPKEVVRVTNEEFVEVDRDDLRGTFDLKLTISTAEEDNQKVDRLAFLFQTMGNSVPWDITKYVLSEISTLSKLPTLAQKIESFEPQPDPMAQKKAELEVAILEAELAEIQSKTMKNQASAQKDMADSGLKSSSRDKQDLDYIEQESGVTQERDLQKMGAQAKANLGLEIGKAMLTSNTKAAS